MLACDLVQGVSRTWTVIEDPGGEDLFAKFQEPVQPVLQAETSADGEQDDHEYQLADESGSEREDEEAKEINWQKFKPITHEEFQRRRRSSESPFGMLFSWLGGAFVAIPIALLIMWHFLGTDVGDAAPMVAKYVPWIVPEKMRGNNGGPAPSLNLERDKNDRPRSLRDGLRRNPKFDVLNPDSPAPAGETKPSMPSSSNPDSESNLENPSQENANSDPKQTKAGLDDKPSEADSAEASNSNLSELGRLLGEWENAGAAWDDNQIEASNKELAQAFRMVTSRVGVALSKLDSTKLSHRVWFEKAERCLRGMTRSQKIMDLLRKLDKNSRQVGAANGSGLVLFLSPSEVANAVAFDPNAGANPSSRINLGKESLVLSIAGRPSIPPANYVVLAYVPEPLVEGDAEKSTKTITALILVQ